MKIEIVFSTRFPRHLAETLLRNGFRVIPRGTAFRVIIGEVVVSRSDVVVAVGTDETASGTPVEQGAPSEFTGPGE